MCGICGQYNYGTPEPVRRRDIEAMTNALVHRGPDDEGYYLAGPLGFGFRRLSIIDLAGGHQPMSDEEQSVWVVFNGEIYNFQELREELEGFGHIFRTRSDTEVIVHGYKQWGDEVLNRLNGMFGLAIWDARERRLVLARDPFGIKLLYYRIDPDRLYFGSEIRAVRATMSDSVDLDPVSLNLFLRYRYTPSPHTMIKGVRKLAPGTKLVVQNGSYELSRWYKFRPTPFAPAKSPGEAREELLAVYQRAVRRQLISDVPVGLLLSGGLDSGLLLVLMNLMGVPGRPTPSATAQASQTMSWPMPRKPLACWVRNTLASRFRSQPSRKSCRKSWRPWKSRSPRLRLSQCISSVNAPGMTSK